MTDKTIFREVFNYFTRFAPGPSGGDDAAYWLEASEALGQVCARLEGAPLAVDLLCAVYTELERRATPPPAAVL